ncbi:hypothetical protein MHYP_G00281340 [Metynnis hypsauchen]
MERRGRVSRLHKALEGYETGEDRVQLLEGLILKTRTRTSSPCRVSQSSEIWSKEVEERGREQNNEDGKAEETVKRGKSKYRAVQTDFQSPALRLSRSPAPVLCPVSSSAGISVSKPVLVLIRNSTILLPSAQHSTHLQLMPVAMTMSTGSPTEAFHLMWPAYNSSLQMALIQYQQDAYRRHTYRMFAGVMDCMERRARGQRT